MKTRLRECWCYLIYPHQENAQAEVEWASSKIPAQAFDGDQSGQLRTQQDTDSTQ